MLVMSGGDCVRIPEVTGFGQSGCNWVTGG
jgi:hypothetical protein